MNKFTYNHLFVALKENTLKGMISNLEEFIREWDNSYNEYGYKEDYEKFLSRLKDFYENYYKPAFSFAEKAETDEYMKIATPLLEKFKKIKQKDLTNEK